MDELQIWYPRYTEDLARIHDFWGGKGRCMASLYPSGQSYRQVFDEDTVMTAAPRQLEAQGRLPGVNIPTFWPDYGTVSTAKYWGCVPRFDSTGGNIFVDPIAANIDDALSLAPCAVDDPQQDGVRAIRMFSRLKDVLGSDRLWLRTPDMQGPLNTAALIMNQEAFFMAMHESPDEVHELLKRVTEFLIEHGQYLHEESGGRVLGNIWPYTIFPCELGLSFTEDIMPLVSAAIYAEFGIPCLKRFADAFGGLHIHCCGSFGRHAPALAAARLPIRAIEFHYPFTTVDQLMPLVGQGTVLIPYFNEEHGKATFPDAYTYYRSLLNQTGTSTRFWFAIPEDGPAARQFAEELGFRAKSLP